MLLRHNPSLKKIYKYYANPKSVVKEGEEFVDNENILGLNLQKVWTFVKELKIMSPKVTISLINRLFYQGTKNRYELKSPLDELKKKLELMKEAGENNCFLTIDPNELFVMNYTKKCLENSDNNKKNEGFLMKSQNFMNNGNEIMRNINIHDGNRVVLYRNFVELIVRIAYLKYEDLSELHRSVEKLIVQKIEPLMELKKKKIKDSSFHSTVFIEFY